MIPSGKNTYPDTDCCAFLKHLILVSFLSTPSDYLPMHCVAWVNRFSEASLSKSTGGEARPQNPGGRKTLQTPFIVLNLVWLLFFWSLEDNPNKQVDGESQFLILRQSPSLVHSSTAGQKTGKDFYVCKEKNNLDCFSKNFSVCK